ncbi:hypothetical protein H9Q72_011228 [Fusarium xylarioides]|uniref:Ankyrin repeat protein n=1 Tax=Fusarium xylarioides TaxID=221167 RepID=A0A9P7KX83_9HYPO|nr:hypothetical protein H9Q72_011228 [Fusarium xylarioides]
MSRTPEASSSSNNSSDAVHEMRNSGTDEPVESSSNRFLTTDSARSADSESHDLINLMLNIETDHSYTDKKRLAEVSNLLRGDSAQVNGQDEHKRTPLHIAAEHGMLEIARMIIDFDKRTIQAKDKNMRQPLHVACREGKTETARLFLDAGADIEAEQYQETTALDDAAYHGHTDVVNLLLDTGANVDVADYDGYTPLHNASSQGHIEVVRAILKHPKTSKTTIDAQDNFGWAALHMAIWEDHPNIVSFLLEEGADLTLKTSDGWTPLFTATPRYPHIIKIILTYSDKTDVQLEVKDDEGYTPLLEASRKSVLATTRILIEAGANRKAQDKYGRTALHLASKTGNVDMVKLLFPLLGREMIKHQCNGGNTPLHLACGARDSSHSSDNSSDNSSGNSSDSSNVFVIWEWEHHEGHHGSVIQFLLEHGADVHAKNDAGDTPLHYAAASGISSRLEPLLKVVARQDMLAQNKRGWTALRSAYEGTHPEIAMAALLESKHLQKANFGEDEIWLDAFNWVASNRAAFGIANLLFSKRPNPQGSQSLPLDDANLIEFAAKQLYPDLILFLVDDARRKEDALKSAFMSTVQAIQDRLEETTEMDSDRRRLKMLWMLMVPMRESDNRGLVDKTLQFVKNQRGKLQELTRNSLLKDSLNANNFGPRRRHRVAEETHSSKVHDPKPRDNRLDYLAELEDILRDPPRTHFHQHFKGFPTPEPGPDTLKLLQEFEATVTIFLEDEKESGTITRHRTVKDTLYGNGPKKTVEDTVKAMSTMIGNDEKLLGYNLTKETQAQFTWVHLPATNLVWMKVRTHVQIAVYIRGLIPTLRTVDLLISQDLFIKIMEKGPYTPQYHDINSFFQNSLVHVPNEKSRSRFLRPQALAKHRVRSAHHGKIMMADLEDPGKTPHTEDEGNVAATAVYMPYFSFSTSDPNQEGSEMNDTNETKELRAEYRVGSLEEEYGESVHGSPTLDEWYYHFGEDEGSKKDRNDRNETQVVSKYLETINTEDHEGQGSFSIFDLEKKPARRATILRVNQLWIWTIADKWLITATSYNPEPTSATLDQEILKQFRQQGQSTGSSSQPRSATEMSRFIVQHCIGSYDRPPPSGCPVSIGQAFSHFLNRIGRDESAIFEDFRNRTASWQRRITDKRQKKREDVGSSDTNKTTTSFLSLRESKMSPNEEIRDAIRKTESLFCHIKDVRDELNILRSAARYQENVQKGLTLGEAQTSELLSKSVLNDIREMEVVAERIQLAVGLSLIPMGFNSVANLETGKHNIIAPAE